MSQQGNPQVRLPTNAAELRQANLQLIHLTICNPGLLLGGITRQLELKQTDPFGEYQLDSIYDLYNFINSDDIDFDLLRSFAINSHRIPLSVETSAASGSFPASLKNDHGQYVVAGDTSVKMPFSKGNIASNYFKTLKSCALPVFKKEIDLKQTLDELDKAMREKAEKDIDQSASKKSVARVIIRDALKVSEALCEWKEEYSLENQRLLDSDEHRDVQAPLASLYSRFITRFINKRLDYGSLLEFDGDVGDSFPNALKCITRYDFPPEQNMPTYIENYGGLNFDLGVGFKDHPYRHCSIAIANKLNLGYIATKVGGDRLQIKSRTLDYQKTLRFRHNDKPISKFKLVTSVFTQMFGYNAYFACPASGLSDGPLQLWAKTNNLENLKILRDFTMGLNADAIQPLENKLITKQVHHNILKPFSEIHQLLKRHRTAVTNAYIFKELLIYFKDNENIYDSEGRFTDVRFEAHLDELITRTRFIQDSAALLRNSQGDVIIAESNLIGLKRFIILFLLHYETPTKKKDKSNVNTPKSKLYGDLQNLIDKELVLIPIDYLILRSEYGLENNVPLQTSFALFVFNILKDEELSKYVKKFDPKYGLYLESIMVDPNKLRETRERKQSERKPKTRNSSATTKQKSPSLRDRLRKLARKQSGGHVNLSAGQSQQSNFNKKTDKEIFLSNPHLKRRDLNSQRVLSQKINLPSSSSSDGQEPIITTSSKLLDNGNYNEFDFEPLEYYNGDFLLGQSTEPFESIFSESMLGDPIQKSPYHLTQIFKITGTQFSKVFPLVQANLSVRLPQSMVLKLYDEIAIQHLFEPEGFNRTKTLEEDDKEWIDEKVATETKKGVHEAAVYDKIREHNLRCADHAERIRTCTLFGSGDFEIANFVGGIPRKSGTFLLLSYIEPDDIQLKDIIHHEENYREAVVDDILSKSLKAVQNLNKIGIHHNDLASRNFIISNNEVYIIDFQNATFNNRNSDGSFAYEISTVNDLSSSIQDGDYSGYMI